MQLITDEEKRKKHIEVDEFLTQEEFLEEMKKTKNDKIYTHEEFRKIVENKISCLK